MHARSSFEYKDILKEDYEKTLLEQNYEKYCLKFAKLQNMFRKIIFLVIYHLGSFGDLIQSGF